MLKQFSIFNSQFSIFNFILAFAALFLFAGCEAEFSPNTEWSEIPVVYGVLDQDDDTSYIRVQRCFLGEGNQYDYARIADSINYPQGALSVFIEEWNATATTTSAGITALHATGSSPRHIYNFDYKEIVNKEQGIFYNTVQPVYVCCTAGQLDSSCIYRLVVVNNTSGDTIATSQTSLIYGDLVLSKPNNVTQFQFAGSSGSKTCEIIWSAIQGARQYQPIVRFFYRDFIVSSGDTTITPHSIDIPCNVVKSNMRDPFLSTKLDQNYFLSTIKSKIEDRTCNKNIIDTVEIFITCCTEPLAAYIYANNPAGSLNQEPFTYTNINGGLGVFAARRTHISFRVRTPLSSVSNYIKSLKELNVGF